MDSSKQAVWIALAVTVTLTLTLTTRSSFSAEPVAGGQFRDVAAESTFRYVTHNGYRERKYFIQPMTGGVAVLDYDGDGSLDLFFTNGAEFPSLRKTNPDYHHALLRNRGDGAFEDRTNAAGLSGAGLGYGMGVAAGDFDNDGRTDLFICGAGRNALLRNSGKGSFIDVTTESGLNDKPDGLLSVGAAWLDYDHDGLLDLFVSNYTTWTPAIDKLCADQAGRAIYCGPTFYESVPNSLYRNLGNGKFENVSKRSGISGSRGKGMGVSVADFDADGFEDVLVVNDTERNFLFINQGDGSFKEEGLWRGVALNDDGIVVNGMGSDAKDYDNDGAVDVFYNDLATQMYALFRNEGEAGFRYVSGTTGISQISRRFSGWSAGFIDFDNDGWKDIYSANGHVDYIGPNAAQHDTMFRNIDGRLFSDVSASMGTAFAELGYQRGSAFADLNNDGAMDIVVTRLNERPRILFNSPTTGAHWLMLELTGKSSNRDAIGAKVTVTTASGRSLHNHVSTSMGFLSSSDKRVHFGLGPERQIRSIEIRWPSGVRQELKDVSADQLLRVEEPE